MTAVPTPDVTDRTDATDEEFAARIAAFDGEAAPESFDAIAALRRVEALAEELEAPVFRAAIYEGERVQGRHEGEDAERARIASRLRAALAPQPADAEGTGR